MSKQPRDPIPAKTDWSSLLAVCTKCEDGDSPLPGRIKDALKQRESREIRASKSSCLDVCPKKGVCASLIGRNGAFTAVFDSHADPDDVIDYLIVAAANSPNSRG